MRNRSFVHMLLHENRAVPVQERSERPPSDDAAAHTVHRQRCVDLRNKEREFLASLRYLRARQTLPLVAPFPIAIRALLVKASAKRKQVGGLGTKQHGCARTHEHCFEFLEGYRSLHRRSFHRAVVSPV